MRILAEIADKMPSAFSISAACLILSPVCAAVTIGNGVAGRIAFVITLLLGVFFAADGYREAFGDGLLRNEIWSELGWRYVISSIGGPLLPPMAVVIVLAAVRGRGPVSGFPLDGARSGEVGRHDDQAEKKP